MGEITFIIVLLVTYLVIAGFFVGRTGKKGREGISSGKEVSAVIVNENKVADRSAKMRLVDDEGRRYEVKMSPTEAHIWIKGDRVRILISEEDHRKYRVLFSEYFRNNEQRFRDYVKELIEKKISVNLFAARFVNYTKESLEAFKNSKLESQRMFVFLSLMKVIDLYTVYTAVMAVLAFFYVNRVGEGFKSWIVPLVIIGCMVLFINSAVKTCVKIKSEAEKSK